MTQDCKVRCCRSGFAALRVMGGAIVPSLLTLILPSFSAQAQITPDNSLGAERSQVAPTSNIRGLPGILIRGGATRGRNLFQSFSEFNVGEGQRVYFANPAGIESILSRVTGKNPSNILGTLGVNGAANLFLINPNGILFGANSRLDIAGSFVATTAASLTFENGLKFSATNPEAPPLLTVTLRPGLQYGTQYQGNITNAGTLAVGAGQTLSLQGNGVTHTGSLTAPGGTVQVLGNQVALLDAARIDVSGTGGGGTVLVGGDFQGKGTVPTATQAIVGKDVAISADALDTGNGGKVVIWANGSTQFNGKISARGGSNGGDGGNVEVSGKQTLNFNGYVDTTAAKGAIGNLLLDPYDLVIDQPVTSATEISLQADNNITFNAPVTITVAAELTAQAGDSIFVNSNLTTNGGSISLEASKGIIVAKNVEMNTCPTDDCGTSAFITLDAMKQIQLESTNLKSRSSNSLLFSNGEFQAVAIVSREGSVSLDKVGISTTNFGSGNAGLVVITAKDTVEISNSLNQDRRLLPGIFSRGNEGGVIIGGSDLFPSFPTPKNIRISNSRINVDNDPTGTGGTTTINSGIILLHATDSIAIEDGSLISSSTFRSGDAGGVIIQTGGTVSLSNNSKIFSNVESTGVGNAGAILVQAGAVALSNGSVITSSTFGQGDAGAVLISSSGDVSVENGSIIATLVGQQAAGNAGGIIINAKNVLLNQDSFLSSDSFGQGDAGGILVTADRLISVKNNSGIRSTVDQGLSQNAGDIFLTSRSLHVRNGSEVNVSNSGTGKAGDIVITDRGVWVDDNSVIAAESFSGQGGNVFLNTDVVILGRSSDISTSTVQPSQAFAPGAGNIIIGRGNLISISAPNGSPVPSYDGRTLLIAGKTPSNNDIAAFGLIANGGFIQINAFRLQDIAKRPLSSTTNDISAESAFGDPGQVAISTLDIFPSVRVSPLPERSQTPRIAQGCDPRVRQESSQFTFSGRGGLAANAAEGLNQDTLAETGKSPPTSSAPIDQKAAAIAPARGWLRNADGSIHLTAYVTDPTVPANPASLWYSPPACNAP